MREAAAHLPDEDDEEDWHGQEEQVNGGEVSEDRCEDAC